ncbi:Uridine kinase [Bdellovibrio bacteriovorus]|uniref:uridine kinase n=1 Tax=Bdellovibrio bacteriovorus TaxID=959 RepID=UPI00045C1536|nr:uridine kinase [Bdellovibrio bacteriovorus]AHZ85139.1 cytidine kinase [Bdellovibrio bacteriovorus]BEV69029.1 Uridine kinase [Bdellovibrio bacteriovorus]
MQRPHIIGVAGGSGSGKTHFAKELQQLLGEDNCSIIYQDNYYIDQSAKFDGDGGSVNFDHPSSLDFTLLAQGLRALKSGQSLNIPIYDFVTHSRKKETLPGEPKKVIIIDGILILHSEEVRQELDEAIFFDTPESLRFERRLKRDVHERGRTPDGVRKQFELQVRPMHNQFVEPSKDHAHTIIKDLGDYSQALKQYQQKLSKAFLQ